jgi:geranylgeranyl reductase family protein
MSFDYDVIVVGAGPGGATAARFCAQAGLHTLLVEKERFPRYKPCAGSLSPKTIRLLEFDLSPVVENAIYGVKFTYCLKEPIFIKSTQPIVFMVMRDRFDQFLVRKALEQGVNFLEGEKVFKVKGNGDVVELELARGDKLRCNYLIGADGPSSIVAKSISLLPSRSNGRGIGLEAEIPFESVIDFPREDLHHAHLDFGRIPNGYGWIFPKREGLSVGIGGMFREGEKMNPRKYFTTFLKGLTYFNEGKIGRVMGHLLPFFYDERQRVSEGKILLVGDAGCLMDPLTGEGIYQAIQSGMLAAKAVIQSKIKGISPSAPYQSAVREIIFENLKWALNISQVIYRFTKFSYRTLKDYPELGNLYVQVLGGDETYQSFVIRVKERMKDLLKGRLSEKIRKAMAGV